MFQELRFEDYAAGRKSGSNTTSLFGSSSQPQGTSSLFGSSTNSAFGQNKTSAFGGKYRRFIQIYQKKGLNITIHPVWIYIRRFWGLFSKMLTC